MLNIGILGGSFDPVHNSHLQMAETALKEFCLDKILFVPAFVPPHKTKLIASDVDRYNMLSIVLSKYSNCEIDTYELDSKKSIYSYQMLDYMQNKYPKYNIKMIIGSDSFNQLSNWKNTNYIIEKFGFVVIRRPNIEIDKKSIYFNKCLFSNSVMPLISSTEVRNLLENGLDVSKFVPLEVYNYIKEHNLYVND